MRGFDRHRHALPARTTLGLAGIGAILLAIASLAPVAAESPSPDPSAPAASATATATGTAVPTRSPGSEHLVLQLTDDAGVLGGDAAAVQSALDDLGQRTGIRLWVWIMRTTAGHDPNVVADAAFAANGLTATDALLVHATDDGASGLASSGALHGVSEADLDTLLETTIGRASATGDHAGAIAAFAKALGNRIASGAMPSIALATPVPTRSVAPAPAPAAAATGGLGIPPRTLFYATVLLVLGGAFAILAYRDRVIVRAAATRWRRASVFWAAIDRQAGGDGSDAAAATAAGRTKEVVVVSDRAGKPAEPSMLVDVDRLLSDYYEIEPDPDIAAQAVSFGTSGHRGSSLHGAFNENHILAISEAICRYRKSNGIDGPLYIARDTHALSEPAFRSAVEVLVANGVSVLMDARDGYTPTPALSHAILVHNRGRGAGANHGLADGIVITPSHNPPEDGGFKYNPPNGGPADTDVTRWIQDQANSLLREGLQGVRRTSFERAIRSVGKHDYIDSYVGDLDAVIDMEAIHQSGLRIGVDPLGGASVAYWPEIRDRYKLDLTVTNETVDPQFGFMTVDWDGRIRMDPSSPYAMARLVGMKDRFDLALGNDTDADRHGIVAGESGLMNPNHFLSAAVSYLFGGARDWSHDVGVGKTLVSSSMIDRVVADLGRRLVEVPVGFKWFVDGLIDGSIGFGGEESAGASFLRRDGSVWSTDKDGIIACLLAAELTARMERNPAVVYRELTEKFGAPVYRRIDAPASRAQKEILATLAPSAVRATHLAGEPIADILTTAPGNGAKIGGLKVVTEHAWFAARPSGTEDVYKIYAESFRGEDQLERLIEEAQALVSDAFAGAPAQ